MSLLSRLSRSSIPKELWVAAREECSYRQKMARYHTGVIEALQAAPPTKATLQARDLRPQSLAPSSGALDKKMEPADTILQKLESIFLETFWASQEEIKKELGYGRPVLILHKDDFTLVREGGEITGRYIPKEYHQIKNVAHIACMLQAVQSLRERGGVAAEHGEALKTRCSEEIRKGLALIESKGARSGLKKHEPLLKQYLEILEAGRAVVHPLLPIQPALQELIKEASVIRTDALYNQMQTMQKWVSPLLWKHLVIVVKGPWISGEERGQSHAPSLAKLCPYLNGKHSDATLTKLAPVFEGKKLFYAKSRATWDELVLKLCDEDLSQTFSSDKR